MADKSVEAYCLEKILAAPRPRGKIAADILNLLQDATDVSIQPQECPDFVLRSHGQIIGLEHFLVDVLVGTEGSNARLVSKQRQRATKKGSRVSHRSLKKLNKHPIVQQQIETGVKGFDERRFLSEFQRVAAKHGSSVPGYRANVVAAHHQPCMIGAIIEMPCQTEGSFQLYDENGICKNRVLNCTPLTHNLISIIKRTLSQFDFVVILAETLLNETPRDAKVYCFQINNIEQAIKEQRIPTCTSFKLKYSNE